jgi:hypothetical protein
VVVQDYDMWSVVDATFAQRIAYGDVKRIDGWLESCERWST